MQAFTVWFIPKEKIEMDQWESTKDSHQKFRYINRIYFVWNDMNVGFLACFSTPKTVLFCTLNWIYENFSYFYSTF